MQHYTEDPLMDGPRREHRLLLEPVGTTRSLFAAACSAGDWMDPNRYDRNGHFEGFDLHMQAVQQEVHDAASCPSAVSGLCEAAQVMTWDEFWKLIGYLDGHADELHCVQLTAILAQRPAGEITEFGERLAEALYRLDQEQFKALPVTDPDRPRFQTDDHFLYARCAVVAAGREVYEGVLSTSAGFAPYTATAMEGESLLYVASQAYLHVTGREWDMRTRYCVETRSNPEGWPA
ncbi:DUF4240 domain-containing protein [Streptomyces sp. NPDC059982]|uniref:DUF4240 domain-containing protein n=1 Tax=unclassified Streptomyces TaxID=2593676 RepID=UPI00367DC8FD